MVAALGSGNNKEKEKDMKVQMRVVVPSKRSASRVLAVRTDRGWEFPKSELETSPPADGADVVRMRSAALATAVAKLYEETGATCDARMDDMQEETSEDGSLMFTVFAVSVGRPKLHDGVQWVPLAEVLP